MHYAVSSIVVAASVAGSARGAGVLNFSMVPRASSIGSGQSVIIDMYADRSGVTGASAYYLAGFKFDIVGHAGGTLVGDVNDTEWYFEQGVNNGVPSGPDLLDFSGGRLPLGLIIVPLPNPEYVGSVTFTDSGAATKNYTVTLSIIDYANPDGALNVYTGGSGAQSRSSYTNNTGTNHLVQFEIGSFEVIVPTPASLSLTGLVALAAARRRR